MRPIPYLDAPRGTRTYRIALLFTVAACAALVLGRVGGGEFAAIVGAVGLLLGASKGATALQIGAGQPAPDTVNVTAEGDANVNAPAP